MHVFVDIMWGRTMSRHEGRLQAAGLSAQAAHQRLRRKAETLVEEMEEVTSPHGIVVAELHEEDSMVIAVERVIESGRRAKTGT